MSTRITSECHHTRFYDILGIKLWVLYMPSKHTTSRATSSLPDPNHSKWTRITCLEFWTSKLPEGCVQMKPWPDCVPLISLKCYQVDQTSLVTQSSREHILQGRDTDNSCQVFSSSISEDTANNSCCILLSSLESQPNPSSKREVELALVSQRETKQHIPSPCELTTKTTCKQAWQYHCPVSQVPGGCWKEGCVCCLFLLCTLWVCVKNYIGT